MYNILSSYLQSVPLLAGQPVVGKRGRVLQTHNLLSTVIIPKAELLRHYIPQDPYPLSGTQLNNDHSVQRVGCSLQCHRHWP